MNLYLVHAKDLHYTEFVSHDFSGPSYDDGSIYEYVYAETRGKAKVQVFNARRQSFSHLEYTDLHIKTLRKGLDCPAGIGSEYGDPLIEELARVEEPELKPCPECDGGWIEHTVTEPDPSDPEAPTPRQVYEWCPVCGGEGWL